MCLALPFEQSQFKKNDLLNKNVEVWERMKKDCCKKWLSELLSAVLSLVVPVVKFVRVLEEVRTCTCCCERHHRSLAYIANCFIDMMVSDRTGLAAGARDKPPSKPAPPTKAAPPAKKKAGLKKGGKLGHVRSKEYWFRLCELYVNNYQGKTSQSMFLRSAVTGEDMEGTTSDQMSFGRNLQLYKKGLLQPVDKFRERYSGYPFVEKKVVEYVKRHLAQSGVDDIDSCELSWVNLQQKALEFVGLVPKEEATRYAKFTASSGWIANVLKRNGLKDINLSSYQSHNPALLDDIFKIGTGHVTNPQQEVALAPETYHPLEGDFYLNPMDDDPPAAAAASLIPHQENETITNLEQAKAYTDKLAQYGKSPGWVAQVLQQNGSKDAKLNKKSVPLKTVKKPRKAKAQHTINQGKRAVAVPEQDYEYQNAADDDDEAAATPAAAVPHQGDATSITNLEHAEALIDQLTEYGKSLTMDQEALNHLYIFAYLLRKQAVARSTGSS